MSAVDVKSGKDLWHDVYPRAKHKRLARFTNQFNGIARAVRVIRGNTLWHCFDRYGPGQRNALRLVVARLREVTYPSFRFEHAGVAGPRSKRCDGW